MPIVRIWQNTQLRVAGVDRNAIMLFDVHFYQHYRRKTTSFFGSVDAINMINVH